jgi:monofunctional glycosyltransferase
VDDFERTGITHYNDGIRGKLRTLNQKLRLLMRRTWIVLLSVYRVFQILCFLLGVGVIAGTISLSAYFHSFFASMPKLKSMDYPAIRSLAQSRVHDRLEKKDGHPTWVELRDVSRDYLYSIVMSEDSTFFEHRGFNYEAMVNSLAENIREMRPAFGASTISQQVSKVLFLTSEKTITRKIREFFVTLDLENTYNKNQILEIYLNVAEFGPDIIGAQSAAMHYFNKPASQINAAEGAFIALMLPSPKRNHYAVFQNRNLTSSKRKKIARVLREMHYRELISESQYERYMSYNFFGSGHSKRQSRNLSTQSNED